MGRHCAAFGCSNNSLKRSCKNKGVSFYNFPLHDPEKLKKWLINLRRKDFVPNSYSAVCSEHFRKDDFFYQMFTKTRLLKKNAIPVKFFEKVEEKPGPTRKTKMEGKIKPQMHQGKNYKSIIGKKEKRCNKCGFVTFSLHVLYNHKYKCKGQLLGKPSFCPYCKRKFSFITLYKSHKKTCIKKLSRKNFCKNKLQVKHIKCQRKSQNVSSYKYSLSCPICRASFKSKLKFVNHLKQQNCTVQQTVKKNFSARKSFSNHGSSKSSSIYDKKIHSLAFKHESGVRKPEDREQHCCLWCKSVYPSEQLLFMHFKKNEQCAIAFYKQHCFNDDKISSKARKTVHVKARKSFPHPKFKENIYNHKITSNRTARKTLVSSYKKKASSKLQRTTNSALNQCPVCFGDFPDTFTFYQHQKIMNHWGKATKSFTVGYKCIYCSKEFSQLKLRNIHMQNHSDVPEKNIRGFLKSCTCRICSEIFVSPLAMLQHEANAHSSHKKYSASSSNTGSDNEYNDKNKMSSVPSSVKKKLRQQPNSCPVCSKSFSHTVLRNKHFNEVHLKIFECQFCNTKFKSTSSLKNHIQQAHGKNIDCKGCKASFKNELELLQHILKYHPNQDPKLLLPSMPVKNIPSKEKIQGIVDEIRIRHSGKISSNNNSVGRNIEFYCDVCDIGYQKLCGLQRHRQSKLHKYTLEKNLDAFHKSLSDLPSSSTPLMPRKIKQPEILTCSECSEDFTNIKDFVPHRLSHFSVQSKYLKINELNPYMCEICSDVLDSHSKVQLHLFWHLQVESTSSKNSNIGTNKNETIVPDRLSGQHVAKKSFSKASNESLQEVVIGGVSKPLFTCEACNIGFTTKIHYNVHVRKLCKKLKSSKHFAKYSSTRNDVGNESTAEADIVHCRNCNFLFITETKFEQHKEFCIKYYYDSDSEEMLSNLDTIKSALSLDTIVAGCATCAALFDNVSNIEGHIFAHQYDENSASEDITDVLHCALCNSLFSLNAFKEHKNFCKIPVNINRKATKSKHIDVLKSALELKCAVAACISCGNPFDDLETFSEHLMLHQTDQIQNDAVDKKMYNAETSVSAPNFESENSLVDSSTDFPVLDLAEDAGSDDQEHSETEHSLYKSSDFINDSVADNENKKTSLYDSKQDKTSHDLDALRENFSQLLCLLISDPELMQKLGYGKLVVDVVLVNVLQQMGQKPYTENFPEIDLLRKNIKMLLALCLKDQFLQAIGKGKSADDMVIEALNIFSREELAGDSD